MIANGNYQKDKIQETNENTINWVKKLILYSSIRKQRLRENWSRLQFYWRCDVVETWIIQKEEVLQSSDDVSKMTSLVSIRQLIAKHESFSSSLEAFENEGIRPIVELR